MNAIAHIDLLDTPVPRGGKRKDRNGPARRCIVSGESGSVGGMIRFVLSPSGEIVPDLAGKLPGRGAWLTSDRQSLRTALKRKAFSRAFRKSVDVADDLEDRLHRMLTQRLTDTIAMARKAGQAVAGAEKVRARIQSGDAAILLQATDGADDGTAKVAALARAVGKGRISRVRVLESTELGLAFGREFAIHAALDAGGFAVRALNEATRLSGFREDAVLDVTPEQRPGIGDGQPGPSAESGYDSEAPDAGAQEQDDR